MMHREPQAHAWFRGVLCSIGFATFLTAQAPLFQNAQLDGTTLSVLTDSGICRLSLDVERAGWDSSASPYVAEAIRRHLNVNDCRNVLSELGGDSAAPGRDSPISLTDWNRCVRDHLEGSCTKVVDSTYQEQLAIINLGASDGRFGPVQNTWTLISLATLYRGLARAGSGQWQSAISDLSRVSSYSAARRHSVWRTLAHAYAALGQRDAALASVQVAYADLGEDPNELIDIERLEAQLIDPTQTSIYLTERTLHFTGMIKPDVMNALRQFEHHFGDVILSSDGGAITAAMEMGSWFRQQSASVRVETKCLSACVLALAGGEIRDASDQSLIGVHRFYLANGSADVQTAIEVAQQLSLRIVKYLAEMGVSISLFYEMADAPSSTMRYLNHSDLRTWGLLNREVSVAPIGPPVMKDAQQAPSAPEIPPEGSSTFVQVDGQDAVGNDLPGMPLADLTVPECSLACTQKRDCAAFTFNKSKNVCYLKADLSLLAHDSNALSGYRKAFEGKFKVSDLRLLPNAELTGNTVAELRPIQYADCVLRCEGDNRCAAFSYRNRRCKLFSVATSLARSSGSIAGLRK
jgi:hypothetical protein